MQHPTHVTHCDIRLCSRTSYTLINICGHTTPARIIRQISQFTHHIGTYTLVTLFFTLVANIRCYTEIDVVPPYHRLAVSVVAIQILYMHQITCEHVDENNMFALLRSDVLTTFVTDVVTIQH